MTNTETAGNKKKIFIGIVAICIFILCQLLPTWAADTQYNTWEEVATAMDVELDAAYDSYKSGDAAGATKHVNEAYYSYYEAIGFERNTMTYISGSRSADVELQFTFCKREISSGSDASAVKNQLDTLSDMLHEDAGKLDGDSGDSGGFWGQFIASIIIILREGLEAILVVGAIIAYLSKTGNDAGRRVVWIGCIFALVASFIMAAILNALSGANGASQEVIEGVTALIAVVVLYFVSNWMISKSETEAWNKYINKQIEGSVARGSMFSLGFAAFLAVFREGAEVVLFYQALLVGSEDHTPVWIGFAAGCVVLVFVFIAIMFFSVRLPLKPFFIATSILMFIMSIAFLGSGIKELQEGNVLNGTQVPGVPTIDLLGIYPTVETLVPQIILLVVTVAIFIWHMRRNKRIREEAESAAAGS